MSAHTTNEEQVFLDNLDKKLWNAVVYNGDCSAIST